MGNVLWFFAEVFFWACLLLSIYGTVSLNLRRGETCMLEDSLAPLVPFTLLPDGPVCMITAFLRLLAELI